METATTEAGPVVAWRPLAIPVEHGGWSSLLEPLVLGMLIAPSAAGTALTVAAVAAFLCRHPLRLAVRDWMSNSRFPRTRVCVRLAAMYASIAGIALSAVLTMAPVYVAVPLLAALPFAAVQFAYDLRNRGRALTPELCGAVAMAAAGAACVIAGGGTPRVALAVTVLVSCRSLPTVLYVRSALRGEGFWWSAIAHITAVGAAGALWLAGLVPPWVMSPVVALLVRSLATPLRKGVQARRIGVEEIGWGVASTIVLAVLLRP